jgi:hypothetical protein
MPKKQYKKKTKKSIYYGYHDRLKSKYCRLLIKKHPLKENKDKSKPQGLSQREFGNTANW